MRSIANSVSVCLFVCLSICISQNPHGQISPNFCTIAMRYVCTSDFVNDVMFSYNVVQNNNVGNRQESEGHVCIVQFAKWRHRGEVCRFWLPLVAFWKMRDHSFDVIDGCRWQSEEEYITKRPVLLGEGPQPLHNSPAIIPPAVG